MPRLANSSLRSVGLALCLSCLALLGLACRSPKPAMTAETRHGEELYGRMCAVCHGPKGEGYRADAAPRIAGPHFLASVEDGYLKRAITAGRHGTTMSAWGREHGGPLTHQDVDAVVTYMRTWYRLPRARLDRRQSRGLAHRGEEIYTRECAACHGARGVNGPNIFIGSPDLLSTASDAFLRYAITAGRPGTPMPPFSERLTTAEVDDVIALLRAWQRPLPSKRIDPPPRPTPVAPLPLGPVPLNPHGPEPVGFKVWPDTTSIDVIKAQLDRGAKMAILDARAPSDYMNTHIAGAVSVPFYDPSPYFAKLPKDTWIVSYCSCPHAESGTLAQKLKENGFKKVTVLAEGLGVWNSRKYATATGEKSTGEPPAAQQPPAAPQPPAPQPPAPAVAPAPTGQKL